MDDKTVSLKEVLVEIDAMPPVKAEGHEFIEKTCLKTRVGLLPSVQPGWIPCSKKLPELNRSVLVRLSDDFVDPILIMTFNISKCEGDFFYFWRTLEMGIDFDMDAVVAWMPLPEPYKGE